MYVVQFSSTDLSFYPLNINSMKKYTLGLSAIAALFFSACHSKTNIEQQESYRVVSPIIIDTTITKEYVADISAFQNVEIRSRINGFIEHIMADEGQFVRNGQLLFTVNNLEFQQELSKTKAITKSIQSELRSAEIELENTKKLLDKNIIGKPEFDLALAKVDVLMAKLEESKANEIQVSLNIGYTKIYAPFDGIINRIPNKKGSLVEDGTFLTSISNNKEVFAYFNVSEKDYLDYSLSKGADKSRDVTLVLANGSLYNNPGKIETIESEFDRSTGNIAFRAKFPNPDNLLKHGASGKVLVKTKLKNAMLIPQKSTFEVQENIYVFVVGSDNKVVQRKVVPIARLQHLYAIEHRLSINERIIFEGIQNVKSGDLILPKTVSFSKAIN